MHDLNAIRRDFPILHQQVHGKPLVYLDNAATTQKPRQVLDRLRAFHERDNANVHRGVYALAERATQAFEEARETVAAFIGAPSPRQLVWTRGTTESINLVAQSWARPRLRPGDEILLTEMEHHSNLVPWQMVAQATGARLRFIPLAADFTLDLTGLEEMLTPRTRLLAFAHMSNALGTINPARRLADAAHAVGAKVLLDGAQSAPHMPVDVTALDADFFAFSGHKMLAPTGIGALYAKQELLEAMDPYQGGGEMILEVRLEQSTYKEAPHKFEAGTPNIAGAVGMAAAADYLAALGMDAVRRHEVELTEYALDALGSVPGLRILGPRTERGGAISFSLGGIHPHDLATIADSEGVAIRAGHHCAQPLMRVLGVPATARASFYIYNTREEVDILVRALEKARRMFQAPV